MEIAVYGLGYVGLTAAACLTKAGHGVIGVDISPDKIARINRGESPIAEPGLEELIRNAVSSGSLRATQQIGAHLDSCDMAIVCVGTPSAPDGSHNMSHIAEVSRQIANSVSTKRRAPLTVVYRSTIRPGSVEYLIQPIFASVLGKNVDVVELVYNPEFLRESVAISDFFNPPKMVIGTKDGRPSANMEALNTGISAPVFYTNYREAEFTKFVDNSFHALKVSFANEIGRICLKLGVSAAKVHEIFVADTKLNISANYLRPGGAFGGSCLPKDVRALQYIAAEAGVDTFVINALLQTNEAHKDFLFEHCTAGLDAGATILMVGIAFKADSDDLRESPNLDLARRILQAGFDLQIFDATLRPALLVGQNLGYGYAHLPNLASLLISRETAENSNYDLVIDTTGRAGSLRLRSSKLIRLDALP